MNLGATYQYNTGQPLALTSPIQSASLNGGSVMRPTLTGQSITTKVINPTTDHRSSFNPAAFKQIGTYTFGHTPRYLSNVRFPSFTELDATLEKNFKFRESRGFTLCFEAMNAINNVVFGSSAVRVTDTNFGYNPHTQKNTPRIDQISGRFTF